MHRLAFCSPLQLHKCFQIVTFQQHLIICRKLNVSWLIHMYTWHIKVIREIVLCMSQIARIFSIILKQQTFRYMSDGLTLRSNPNKYKVWAPGRTRWRNKFIFVCCFDLNLMRTECLSCLDWCLRVLRDYLAQQFRSCRDVCPKCEASSRTSSLRRGRRKMTLSIRFSV